MEHGAPDEMEMTSRNDRRTYNEGRPRRERRNGDERPNEELWRDRQIGGAESTGIIALFIVMVYGFASLVTAFAGSFTAAERLPLIHFLICSPVLVLCIFAWLVSKHSGKLFAPSDFRNEDNYVEMQMAVVASLYRRDRQERHPSI